MNKKITLFTIIILIIIYFSLLNQYLNSINNNTKGNLINVEKNILTESNLEKFINENYIDNLDSFEGYFDNPNNLTNDKKLKYAFMALSNSQDFNPNINSSLIKKKLVDTFGSNIKVYNEDIIINKKVIKYDKKKDIYLSNGGYTNDYLIIKKINKYQNDNNKATLSFYKFYVKNNKIYGSFEDMNNNYNVIYYINNSSNASKYIEENFNALNSKYHIYTYTFEDINNNIILTRYEN